MSHYNIITRSATLKNKLYEQTNSMTELLNDTDEEEEEDEAVPMDLD